MASQITSLTIGYSTVYSGADQRKHQSSALLVFVREIHRWPVNSPHKWPVTRKMFPFDDVIMSNINTSMIKSAHDTESYTKMHIYTYTYIHIHRYIRPRILVLILMLSYRQQGSDLETKRDKLPFSGEARIPNSASQAPNRQQTECLLTNRLGYPGWIKK